jgi:hypothetical protein
MGRGRPSLSSNSNTAAADVLPVAIERLRVGLEALRDLSCFDNQHEALRSIDEVLYKALPLASESRALPPPPPFAKANTKMELGSPRPRASSKATPTSPLYSLHDGAWAIILDLLNLQDVVHISECSKELGVRVPENCNVLALGTLPTTWVSAQALQSLAKFNRVKTLHWCINPELEPHEPEGRVCACIVASLYKQYYGI